ncbi:DNA polymerase III subunit delta' [bacterium]|nr:DNA polymerase III subunit delta' [bacterium]MBU1434923.1 DNA polymerase III subunit delta' [bacterium]MBU1504028.1 DNA polymerase III subunit delta' [bacterium]
MLLHNSHTSHILISSEIEHEVERLKGELHGFRIVTFVEDEFKIENAKAVVAEAYISESQTKYIILASKNFNIVSQNSLLKVLEEPPRNIEFIIISPTKSNLLPTVRSRLPILQGKKTQREISININLAKTDYKEIFEFLKENARVSKSRAQELVEELYYRATVIDTLALTSLQLENFDRAYRLLELNSRPISVLAMILMSFTREK